MRIIDGASTNGTDRRVSVMPNPDVIDEFKIETSNFDASFGHSTGLNIYDVDEIRGQRFPWDGHFPVHKSALERRIVLREAEPLSQIAAPAPRATSLWPMNSLTVQCCRPVPRKITRPQSVGPVYIPKVIDGRNKLFFFFGFSELKNRQSARPSEINYTVPTVAMRGGDFSQLLQVPNPDRYIVYDPLTTRPDPARPGHYIGDAFPGNVIPQAESRIRCTISTEADAAA